MALRIANQRKNITNLLWWFVIFCLFPYIRLLPLNTDSQPNALVFGVLYLFASKKQYYSQFQLQLFALFIFSLLLLCFSPWNYNSIRSVSSYLSLFVIASVSYDLLKTTKGIFTFNLFKNVVFIWLFIGLIQQLIVGSFGTQLVARELTGAPNSGRGVVSLAPEPTFYAIICVLFSIMAYLNFRNHPEYSKIQIILIVQIIILARSATIIIFGSAALILFVVVKTIIKKPLRLIWILTLISVLIVCIKAALPYMSQFRAVNLISKLFEEPMLFILVDESVNERFLHVYFPIIGFIENFGLPHSYGDFGSFLGMAYDSNEYNHLFFKEFNASRIMSGIGSIIYELGLLALPFLILLFKAFRTLIKHDISSLFFILLLCIVLVNAMPISNSLLGFVIGNIFYRAKFGLNDYKIDSHKG